MSEKILFKYIDVPNICDIDVYEKYEGYQALRKALKEYKPSDLVEMVKKSGLRGRGGAGFPTGLKWSFLTKGVYPRYLTCNADEGEPGTFKDRELMEKNPHQLIEGIIISSFAIECNLAYIYIRGEFVKQANILEKAIASAYNKGYLGKNILGSGFNLDLYIHRGAGAYICGEETALLESLEGERGNPKLKPPFPASAGLYEKPTIINNVETLSNIPHIVLKSPEWFASIGTPKSTGTKIFSLSGHINKPGNYELPMGTPLRELIYEYGGGIRNGRKIKAIIPGGSSTPMLTEQHLDIGLDFESVASAGSMLGSGGVIVIDDSTCIVKVSHILAKFYKHESCGKCTPCREGTYWILKIYDRLENGKGREEDIETLLDICDNMSFKTFCPLGDAAIPHIQSSIKHFRDEYEYHIKEKKCKVNV